MIPWRLQFSGIRDYGPTEMNLDTISEHILITGPNGAGKSTLSFCMGAVLRSSKVDISGLKSQNLPEDQTWKATIHFLFKNEGASRIDGPLYIEFRLLCEQQPSQPIKLHYEIHDGDELNHIELRQKYRSGDINKNNFTAYQRELQFKYKIHPDLYYLIWYQQEVNQFAVMAPEERFRIFSEMHGIDKIQKDWEISLEGVKEAQESLATATSKQKAYEFELSIARSKKDRYEDNRNRLETNGFEYARTTNELLIQTDLNLNAMANYIEDREFEIDELTDVKYDIQSSLNQEQDKKQILLEKQTDTETELLKTVEQLKEKETEATQLDTKVKGLASELNDLTEAYQKLSFREEETKEKWLHAKEQVAYFTKKEQEQQQLIDQVSDKIEANREEQSNKKAAIHQWKEKSKEAYALLDRYQSSYILAKEMQEKFTHTQSLQKQRDEKERVLQRKQEMLEMYQRNQIESQRQKAALHHLRKQGLKGYPLRHFVQLKDQIKIEQEQLFNAIKYTIFYVGSTCQPINDLYHVSLTGLVPDRSIIDLPKWGLKMRDGLSSSEQNQAARVLWWIEQFFTTKLPMIKEGHLVDDQGIRGSQEQETFILSKRALEEQKQRLQIQIKELSGEIKVRNEHITKENEIYQVWNADVQKVIEAEAFLSTKAEQTYRINANKKLEHEFKQLQIDREQYEQKRKTYWKESYHWENEQENREADLAVYKQFGEQREKIDRLHKQEQTLKDLRKEITSIKHKRQERADTLEELAYDVRRINLRIESLEDNVSQNQRTISQVLNQRNEKQEEYNATKKQYELYQKERDDLQKIIPKLVEKSLSEERVEQSKFELQNLQNQAKVEFFNACNEKDIDPNAVENFKTLESEVERKKEELQAAKNLLEENQERAIENEKRLETAIAMQVQKINLLFEHYMAQFQFEGKIQYDKSMTKKDRPIFKLFIYVRKEGHRGKLEDVSFKARGGRVGKGVSGGEESLSSLLFALSLLQNLENKASFIVMDEFDSALDEARKASVFELYAKELKRKLIILSPKGHEDEYYDRFSKAFVVSHNPLELKSTVKGLKVKK